MQREAKTMFSEHVMCALFCVLLRAARVEKEKLVVTMDSQAAYACSGAPPRPQLRGHIFYFR